MSDLSDYIRFEQPWKDRIQREHITMRKALEYYANPANWENGIMPYHRVKPPVPGDAFSVHLTGLTVTGVPDRGETARKALAELKEG